MYCLVSSQCCCSVLFPSTIQADTGSPVVTVGKATKVYNGRLVKPRLPRPLFLPDPGVKQGSAACCQVQFTAGQGHDSSVLQFLWFTEGVGRGYPKAIVSSIGNNKAVKDPSDHRKARSRASVAVFEKIQQWWKEFKCGIPVAPVAEHRARTDHEHCPFLASAPTEAGYPKGPSSNSNSFQCWKPPLGTDSRHPLL